MGVHDIGMLDIVIDVSLLLARGCCAGLAMTALLGYRHATCATSRIVLSNNSMHVALQVHVRAATANHSCVFAIMITTFGRNVNATDTANLSCLQ